MQNIGAILNGKLLRSPAVARVLPFALYVGFLVLAPFVDKAFPMWDARWLYAVKIGAVLAALVAFRHVYAELRDARDPTPGDLALAAVCGTIVFLLWINLEFSWAVIGHPEDATGFDPRDGDGAVNWALVVVRIFGAAAVVPIMEELFWRSFVMRWINRPDFLGLSPSVVGLRAVVFSSLLFGFEHAQWFAGILAGLAYAWLYVRSGNLWLPIVSHAATNFLLGVYVVVTGSWRFW